MKEDPSLKWEEEKELAKQSENDQRGGGRTQKEALSERKEHTKFQERKWPKVLDTAESSR